VFKDEERPVTIENVLAALVDAVRADEHEEDRSARDLFKTARSRRRRLGLLSFGAGPLVGVATHIVDLYCETATVCDLADLHSIALTEHDIAAHMLVLWGILDGVDEAEAVMTGTGTQSLASIIAGRIHGGAAEHIPDKLTKRAAIQALWDARHLVDDAREVAGAGSVRGVVFTGHRTKQLIKKAELQLGVGQPPEKPGMTGRKETVSPNTYLNLYLDAGISGDQEKYGRCLDAVLAQEGIGVDDIVGIGEKDDDLCVVYRQAITLVSEKGMFNKRLEVRRVASIASVARLRKEIEGFKGRGGLSIIGYDSSGEELWKINWGLGGPDGVLPMVERQSDHLFKVIGEAMDKVSDAPARPSVSSASSKAGALMDWAADVVKASGVEITNERVEEHANMVAATMRLYEFLPLGAPFGIDSLNKFYPAGEMPDGTPIETFDELYGHVVVKVGSARPVDQVIDKYLADHWAEFVNGCRETYS